MIRNISSEKSIIKADEISLKNSCNNVIEWFQGELKKIRVLRKIIDILACGHPSHF